MSTGTSPTSSTFLRPNTGSSSTSMKPSPLSNSIAASNAEASGSTSRQDNEIPNVENHTSMTIHPPDYDAFDALLHSVYLHTQSSNWFDTSAVGGTGVCIRVPGDGQSQAHYRVFPYNDTTLLPFHENVSKMGSGVVIAVKVRGASVHAVVSRVRDMEAENGVAITSIPLTPDTCIQILPSLANLPNDAERDQRAAFIMEDASLVMWSSKEGVEDIIDLKNDLDEKLIKYVWRTRGKPKRTGGVQPPVSVYLPNGLDSSPRSNPDSRATSIVDFSDRVQHTPPPEYLPSAPFGMEGVDRSAAEDWIYGEKPEVALNLATATETKETAPPDATVPPPPKKKAGFFGWWRLNKEDRAKEGDKKEKRKHVLLGPLYAGIGAGLSLYFVTAGIATLIEEWALDGDASRFALVVVLPIIFCVSLFFCLQLIGNISLIFGPVSQYHENSVYYSAVKPAPNPEVDRNLPHITIQLPVYKESLELTIGPSIMSIKQAMQTYARQGGSSAIFVCDDGLQLLSEADRQERTEFYATHNIGWVARPKHDGKEGGFKRPGKFKKASNMNYALTLSMKLERHLAKLIEEREERLRNAEDVEGVRDESDEDGECLEDKAMNLAIEEVYEENGKRWKAWACNGKSLRIGEIILIIDADTIVPEDCFRDAAREMAASEELAIIQHESDVMQVAHHYFENGITHFTRRINKCISYGCANGEVAPFVGHNAFLRWSAVQDASFIDENDVNYIGSCALMKEQADPSTFEPPPPERKMWSESNVSEDFDLALRLLLKGYTLRWATYSNGGFKEGVSLTIVDELARWQKYAYGCDEIIFNPLIHWWRKGPISKQLSGFMMSKAPVHYKIGMSSYMFSYYGIAAATVGSVLNYLLLGLAPNLDRFYLKSFEILLACVVVFPGIGNLGFTLLEYRLGHRSVGGAAWENLRWLPFFVFFFGGLSIHLSTAILAHLFSYDMTWGSTGKEVEKSTFWIEVPRIIKNFKLPFVICFLVIFMMIIFTTNAIPFEWQIAGWNWALIIPLSLNIGCHIGLPIVLNPWLMKFSY
ncbi:hypothetical protein E1B28_011678 [Marasmius oreades]|uniref:Glycosyltransferase 2-like domain-containing protein n=1 Tax=Marasmius oreades TaxID=181124 RepID=A0A9P7URG3_9AGAR|nr:uncharacterized protein E1B28_011678 [Marasmius oreades]KAG7090061.1 hypothetical protein E1B28_011678 [Marasmius oreades]